MRRVLGVSCSGSTSYLAVVEVDESGGLTFLTTGPERLELVEGGDAGDAFVRTLGEWKRALVAISPDAVALLLPESDQRTRKVHSAWAPRIEAETLFAVSAGLLGLPFDRLARPTVRARLGLTGKLDDAAKAEPSQGRYWTHRALALFAAKSLAQHAMLAGWPSHHTAGSAFREVSNGSDR
jgi:hypothetical protein